MIKNHQTIRFSSQGRLGELARNSRLKPLAAAVTIAGWFAATPVMAQDKALSELTLQDLMNIEMVSSSKFKQELSEITAAAYVITEEEIKNAGVTDLPQLLSMVPGLFIAEATSNSWAMGMRGFNSVFSNKVLVMIDGRSLFSPLFSGVFWEQLDVFIPDIERVEVIRGSGSTVWGANAVNGVINIITKSTLDNEEARAYAHTGSQVNYDAGFRAGGSFGDTSYGRFYVKTKDLKGNDYEVPGGMALNDGWSSDAVGFKLEHFGGRDSYEVTSDYISQTVKDTGLHTSRVTQPYIELDTQSHHLSAQWQRQVSVEQAFTLSAQLQQNKRDSDHYRIDDHMLNVDFDGNMQMGDHQFLFGAGARQHEIDFDPGRSYITENQQPTNTKARIYSAYVQDEWRLNDLHSLIFGTKFEAHRHTHRNSQIEYREDLWLPNIRYRYRLSDDSRLWMAVSRSARVPSVSEHAIKIPLSTMAPGHPNNPFPWPFEVTTSGNPDFDKEKVRFH